jgi:hypothetical protein
MASVVQRDDPVAGVAQRLQPAGKHPVDTGAGGKAVDQQHRIPGRIALVEEGKLQAVMGKAGKGWVVEVHRGRLSFSSLAHNAVRPSRKPEAAEISQGATVLHLHISGERDYGPRQKRRYCDGA